MPQWLEVIILGIIEGITEFLPISSTGHLLISQQWMAYRQSDLFLVAIQSGAVIAVALIYKERLWSLFRNFKHPDSLDYLYKLGVAFFITSVGGVGLKVMDFELPESPIPVGLALLIGGVLFIAIEKWIHGKPKSEAITWSIAVWMGLAQLLAAVFPGASRSGTTILIALVMGLSRGRAVEFSFILGIPTLLAAGVFQIATDQFGAEPSQIDWGMLALGTLVSGVVGFAAVKWLLIYVRTHTFVGFGWYRIAVGVLILLLL